MPSVTFPSLLLIIKKCLPSASPINNAGNTSDNEYSAYTIEGLIAERRSSQKIEEVH